MQQIRMVVAAFSRGGAGLWLLGDPMNSDEVKQGRKARHDVKDRGLVFFLENEDLQPLGLHLSDGARWTHQCFCRWMRENAVPCMTKGSS